MDWGTINWANTAVAAFISFVLGFCVRWLYDVVRERKRRRALKKKYGHLDRTYSNFRNEIEPTGGTIALKQKRDGSFETIARHRDGSVDWRGDLRMSLEDENLGTGHYRHEPSLTDYGDQEVRYIPERDELRVRGINRSTTTHTEFCHVWRPL